MITVVIPVGPQPAYKKWLPECIESVRNQTVDDIEILIIDDMAFLNIEDLCEWNEITGRLEIDSWGKRSYYVNDIPISMWDSPWLLGVAHAFNFGVALADHECVFMIGSDDKMYPTCLESCLEEYEKQNKRDGWYNVTVDLSDGTAMNLPNNTCMVTKGLWKMTGGFPLQSTIGGPDALLLSIMLKHMPDRIFQVKEHTPLCWLRVHEHQETRRSAAFYNHEMGLIRNKETDRWKKPEWTRFLSEP